MYHKQKEEHTCGPSSLRNALSNLGKEYSEEELSRLVGTNKIRGTWSFNFKKIGFQDIKFIEKENSSLEKIQALLNDGFQIIVCFFIKEDLTDHYSVIKKITPSEVILQDPYFGDNYPIKKEYFEEIWFCDPKFEKRKKWFFAIKIID